MKLKNYLLLVFFTVTLQSIGQNNRNGYNSVLHQPPEVDFSWNQACLGDTTFFTNGSIRGTFYQWYIYDKNMNKLDSSTSFNISYLFPSPDTFFVFLQADNGHLASSTQMLIIDTALTCDFNFMHCSNQFMNHSTCASSYFWDFGDGSTSTVQAPTHLYPDTGYYSVKFIAYKGAQSDTTVKQIFVDPIAFPTGLFTYSISGYTVTVHAADSSAGIFYNWNFGDGTHLYARDTFHVYSSTGTRTLSLIVWNTCSQLSSSDTIYVDSLVNAIDLYPTSLLNMLSVFPNPIKCRELLNVSFNSGSRNTAGFVIYNSMGEKVVSNYKVLNQGTNKFDMDISSLPVGLYILAVDGEHTISHIKFLISSDQ